MLEPQHPRKVNDFDLAIVDDTSALASLVRRDGDFDIFAIISIIINRRSCVSTLLALGFLFDFDIATHSPDKLACLLVGEVLRIAVFERYWRRATLDKPYDLEVLYDSVSVGQSN